MKKIFLFVELSVFLLIFLLIRTGIAEKCRLVSKNNEEGVCKSIYECPSLLNKWKMNETHPEYCSEEYHIVCCPNQEETGLRISERKCLEYLKHIFEEVKTLPEDPEDDFDISYVDRCGISTTQYSIVGGEDASIREFPHMAAIGDNSFELDDGEHFTMWFCAGSLISEKFVLTAAHCIVTNRRFQGNLITPRVVQLGALNLDLDESSVRIHEVEEGIPYPDYENQFVYYDIGLLRLKKSVELNINIRPACLPVDTSKQHDKIWAIGWGNATRGEFAGYHGILQKLQLPLVTKDECKKTYNPKRKRLPQGLNENILCYGGLMGKDTCPGASGGPVQVVNRDFYCSYSVVGVTSAGVKCTHGYPGLFTKVAEYLEWIENTVWGTGT